MHPGTVTYQGYASTDVRDRVDKDRANAEQARRVDLYYMVVDQVLEDCPFIYMRKVNNAALAPTCRWYTARRVGLGDWFDENYGRRRDR